VGVGGIERTILGDAHEELSFDDSRREPVRRRSIMIEERPAYVTQDRTGWLLRAGVSGGSHDNDDGKCR
jgi:hypothetical protein